jgi:catechol 2,3-dioxygenase-like lactoylglutathione lyase family enzyme
MNVRYTAAGLTYLLVCAVAARDQSPQVLRLDHVSIAVRDLESGKTTYRDQLGFSLKPGRLHPNSINNVHIKFEDGSALELITASTPDDRLATHYLEFLREGEGGAFLALDAGRISLLVPAIQNVAVPFDTTIGSYFESLSFRRGTPLEYLFFIVVHSRPPDLPEHLRHPNTARRLSAVWLAKAQFSAERRLLQEFGARSLSSVVKLPDGRIGYQYALEPGSVYLSDPPQRWPPERAILGVTIEVADLERTRASFGREVRSSVLSGADLRGRFLRVPPAAAHGIWLEFLQTVK